jgi:hypothetical protein
MQSFEYPIYSRKPHGIQVLKELKGKLMTTKKIYSFSTKDHGFIRITDNSNNDYMQRILEIAKKTTKPILFKSFTGHDVNPTNCLSEVYFPYYNNYTYSSVPIVAYIDDVRVF